jgi:predicted DNA-binding transcriptional regulator AlpA
METQQKTWTEKEAATYLNMKQKTLQQWRFYGRGPAYLKLGRAVRYLQSDLDNFLSQSRIGGGEQ